jgi:hypothetical protein
MEKKLDTNSIWRLLRFDKGDIFIYLVFGIILIYVWKISNISAAFILPFIIFIGFMYLRQDYYHRVNLESEHLIEKIKINILKDSYPQISNNSELMLFINSIIIYKKLNPEIFNNFLDICEKYLLKKDIYSYLECIDVFEKFTYSITINMSKEHYLKKKELVNILKNFIKEPKRKMVEMQSFIPYNFYNNVNNF